MKMNKLRGVHLYHGAAELGDHGTVWHQSELEGLLQQSSGPRLDTKTANDV